MKIKIKICSFYPFNNHLYNIGDIVEFTEELQPLIDDGLAEFIDEETNHKNYHKMSVTELRVECKKYGLSTSGKKTELIKRLEEME